MRIAQVAPLYESVPPQNYGGTERVVSYLTEELVALGTRSPCSPAATPSPRRAGPRCRRALRTDRSAWTRWPRTSSCSRRSVRRRGEFDLVHFHVDYLHFPISRRHRFAHVTTLHGRLDIPELPPLHREYPASRSSPSPTRQRRPLPWLAWQGTVYHGLPESLHASASGRRLPRLRRRISPEKRVDRAIRIARRVGMKLKIAARKIDRADRGLLQGEDRAAPARRLVEFLGEVGGRDKDELLGGAVALLFPIDWPEPFGLVMIEAMACGTPVVALGAAARARVIDDGVTGFVVDDPRRRGRGRPAGGVAEPPRCREVFQRRFTAARMAQDYLALVPPGWPGRGRGQE